MPDGVATMRWDPYVMARGDEFDGFWTSHLASRKRRLLLVLGCGFDLRALEAARRIKQAGAVADVWLLIFDNGLPDSRVRAERTEANRHGLLHLFEAAAIKTLNVRIGGAAGSTATSRSTVAAIRSAGVIDAYDDVVVDISAMPRMVAMTVVAKLLHDLDTAHRVGGRNTNLHVTTAESVSDDVSAARGTLSDEVTLVVGFSGQLTAQGTVTVPRVWFPVLGEGQAERLAAIKEKVNPDEICPVIPFPTRQPRRGDEIINEHRGILFDEFQIEPRNILLACEYNPFEAYKQIFRAMDSYRRALKELGSCKAFVPPVSSKLLSIGALLACYDHKNGKVPEDNRLKVGIPYVETAVYGDPDQETTTTRELYSMWIRGEWEV